MTKMESYLHKGMDFMKKKQREALWLIEIATLERDMRSNFEVIGKMYYKDLTKVKDVLDYEYYVLRIQSLEKEIAAIRRKLEELDL